MFIACAVCVAAAADSAAVPASLSSLTEKQRRLLNKMDSLDLLKQNLKRSGLAISEVELLQKSFRDSLRAIRDHIETASTTSPAASSRKDVRVFLKKPETPFDWIIGIVAVFALFSGSLLITGSIRAFISRRSRHRLQKIKKGSPAPVPAASFQSGGSAPQTLRKPQSAFPEQDGVPDRSPVPLPITDTGSRKLRERLDRERPHTPFDMPVIPVLPSIPDEVRQEDPKSKGSLEKKVIESARQGLDVITISKKFHLSIDHVSLILRINHHG